jgi:hypothetical protein
LHTSDAARRLAEKSALDLGRSIMAPVTSEARFGLGWSTWILIVAVLLVLTAAMVLYVL